MVGGLGVRGSGDNRAYVVAICETSTRRLVDAAETARVELGDVVEVVRWENGVLHVRDAAGDDLALRVDGESLIA